MKKPSTIKAILLIFVLFILRSNAISQLPASYDSRTKNYVTPVKDQGLTCGACWAFASCAAIESSWIKNGYGVFDLSEDNLIDCHNFDPAPCEYGNYYITQAILSLHKGIFTELQDNYSPNLQDCPSSSRFPPTPQAYIEEIRFIPGTVNDVKQAIYDYGAVATTMYMNYTDANSWDGTKYKYYDNNITTNDLNYAHCVTIVGWNDNYTFSGAPGNGGWIIKDSYGTNWADKGYFYCSYHDAGILGTNVVFPTKQNIPDPKNSVHVYNYDEFGWVDNYGFGTNSAYALTKYSLLPGSATVLPQQIKRIGTYAISDNTTIDIELYRNFNGNVLSEPITSTSISCPTKGFYTKDFSLKTDTLYSTIFIKVKYTCNSSTIQPIPVEKKETGSSSAFVASGSVCWISSTGKTLNQIGNGTKYDFDLCIKIYTEDTPIALMNIASQNSNNAVGTRVCKNENLVLTDKNMVFDSIKWFVNNMQISISPSFSYSCNDIGSKEFKLIKWYGNNSDIQKQTINVVALPDKPTITQKNNTLESGIAYSYQWLNNDLSIIPGATNQFFKPQNEGFYRVEVTNSDKCSSISEAFNYTLTSKNEMENRTCRIYPNPSKDIINIEFIEPYKGVIQLVSLNGIIVKETLVINEQKLTLYVSDLPNGIYLLNNNEKYKITINR